MNQSSQKMKSAEDIKKEEGLGSKIGRKSRTVGIIARLIIYIIITVAAIAIQFTPFLDDFMANLGNTVGINFSILGMAVLPTVFFLRDRKNEKEYGIFAFLKEIFFSILIMGIVASFSYVFRNIQNEGKYTMLIILYIILLLAILVGGILCIRKNISCIKEYRNDDKNYYKEVAESTNRLMHMRPVYDEWNSLLQILQKTESLYLTIEDQIYLQEIKSRQSQVLSAIVSFGENALLLYERGSMIFDLEASLDRVRQIADNVENEKRMQKASWQNKGQNGNRQYDNNGNSSNREELIRAMGTLHIETLDGLTIELLNAEYKKLAKAIHPDGSNANTDREMQELNTARELIKQELLKRQV